MVPQLALRPRRGGPGHLGWSGGLGPAGSVRAGRPAGSVAAHCLRQAGRPACSWYNLPEGWSATSRGYARTGRFEPPPSSTSRWHSLLLSQLGFFHESEGILNGELRQGHCPSGWKSDLEVSRIGERDPQLAQTAGLVAGPAPPERLLPREFVECRTGGSG